MFGGGGGGGGGGGSPAFLLVGFLFWLLGFKSLSFSVFFKAFGSQASSLV